MNGWIIETVRAGKEFFFKQLYLYVIYILYNLLIYIGQFNSCSILIIMQTLPEPNF